MGVEHEEMENCGPFSEQGLLCTVRWIAGVVVDSFSIILSMSAFLEAVVVSEVISLFSLFLLGWLGSF